GGRGQRLVGRGWRPERPGERVGRPMPAGRTRAGRGSARSLLLSTSLHLQFALRLQPPIATPSPFVAAASVRGLGGGAQVAHRARPVDTERETVLDPHDHGPIERVLEQRSGDALHLDRLWHGVRAEYRDRQGVRRVVDAADTDREAGRYPRL